MSIEQRLPSAEFREYDDGVGAPLNQLAAALAGSPSTIRGRN
jgi:hypothetical protein